MTQKRYVIKQWSLFLLAILLPILAWGQLYKWQVTSLTGYQWFPLFGLIAWMIMWTHYVNGAVRLSFKGLVKTKLYGKLSAYLVLLFLLLHPGILAFLQYRNNQGLPPESFINYVGESLAIAVMMGSLSLIIFLSFEVFDRLKNVNLFKKNWKYISITQSLAMILVYVHALRIGTIVNGGWFQIVWFVCGITLLPCLYIIHKDEFSIKNEREVNSAIPS